MLTSAALRPTAQLSRLPAAPVRPQAFHTYLRGEPVDYRCPCISTLCSNCSCGQVRSAYRTKGWAFTDPQQIEQCAKEGYVTKLRDQAGEGCHMWGEIKINKVAVAATPICGRT